MFVKDEKLVPLETHTYGNDGPWAQDWRTLPYSPELDRATSKALCAVVKSCRHVPCEGFGGCADGSVTLAKKKVYIRKTQRCLIQKSLVLVPRLSFRL
jgi:hypothetical protein